MHALMHASGCGLDAGSGFVISAWRNLERNLFTTMLSFGYTPLWISDVLISRDQNAERGNSAHLEQNLEHRFHEIINHLPPPRIPP